jgi:hypothetical protein
VLPRFKIKIGKVCRFKVELLLPLFAGGAKYSADVRAEVLDRMDSGEARTRSEVQHVVQQAKQHRPMSLRALPRVGLRGIRRENRS